MFARKLNISPHVKAELFDHARRMKQHVVAAHPSLLDYYYWSVGTWPTANVATMTHDVHPSPLTHPIPDDVWFDKLCKLDPSFLKFYERYKFVEFLGVANDADWGIHRHIYDLTSHWNIVLFDDARAADNLIHMWKLHDDAYSAAPQSDFTSSSFNVLTKTCVEQDIDPSTLSKLEEVETHRVNNGDAYLINSWCWHSHTTPDGGGKVNLYLMYIQNTATHQAAADWATWLESL